MFERFTGSARATVVAAQDEARRLGHHHIVPGHLFYGLTTIPDSLAAQALTAHRITTDVVRAQLIALNRPDEQPLDPDALATLGIDLEQVRRAVEASFGPGALEKRPTTTLGHVPFTAESKKVLELSLREAVGLKHGEINSGHLLLGLLRESDRVAVRVLADAGVDAAALRAEVVELFPPRAA
jgi:ATP-dependent Clp protease ATP-binding subunit ClpA